MLSIITTITDTVTTLELKGTLDTDGAQLLAARLTEPDTTRPLLVSSAGLERMTASGMETLRQEAERRYCRSQPPLLLTHAPVNAAMPDQMLATHLGAACAELSIGKLINLFDHIFIRSLSLWHATCQDEEVYLYDDLLLNPADIAETAATGAARTGLDTESATIPAPELERDIPNPYWFAAHRLKELGGEVRGWPMCLCHNNMTLESLLCPDGDSKGESVLFSNLHKVGVGSATTDMAHMEPELLIRLTRLSDERDIRDLARFMDKWFSAATLRDIPRHQYSGNDLMVIKAFEVLRRLRAHADTLVGHATGPTTMDMQLYLASTLERALHLAAPPDLPAERLRVLTLLAGLVCERMLR